MRIAAIRTGEFFVPFAFLLARGSLSPTGTWPGRRLKTNIIPFLLTMTSLSAGSSSQSSESAGDSAAALYPDFSAYPRPKPDGCFPSKRNHIEQNFFILKKNERAHRVSDCDVICSFCSVSFRAFSTTKMRVHLTGQSQGDVRVSACEKVPSACKEYYLAERERDAKKSQQKKDERVKLLNDASVLSQTVTVEKGKRRRDDDASSINPRVLNLKQGQQPSGQQSITTLMVNSNFGSC